LLSLYFSGDPDNAIGTYEQMYITLEDGDGDVASVKYGDSIGEDANNLKSREWTEWAIALQEFSDANANFDIDDVNKVYIGFGNRQTPEAGGSGIVYFDSIRLHWPKCVPGIVVGDLTGDCTVDIYDFIMLANSWHGKPSTAVPIIDLDASNFSAGSWTNTGTLGGKFDVNSADFNDDPTRGMVDGLAAVIFDGNDYLISDFNAPGGITGANDFTVVMTVHNPAIAAEEWVIAWTRRALAGETYTGRCSAFGYGSNGTWGVVAHWDPGPDMGFDGGVPAADMWHRIAVAYDGSTERVLVDGKLNAIEHNKTLDMTADCPVTVGCQYEWDPNDPNSFVDPGWFLSGSVNRIQVYDEGMLQHQLEYMAISRFLADFNSDGEVDFKDLAVMVDKWLKEVLFP